jgi:hypothetical protein
MKKILFLVPFVLSIFLFVPGQRVWACTPPPGGLPHYTTTEHVEAAPVVLEGVASYTAFLNFNVTATVQVVQYIKGRGPAVVAISNFGDSSVCLSSISDGDHFIFLASGDPSSGQLQAFYLSQFDATLPADAQTLTEAITAAGQDPVLVAPLETVLTQAAATATPETDITNMVATINAAAGNTDTAPQTELTEAWATLDASATQIAATQLASLPAGVLLPTPTPLASTSYEAVGLVGVGVVMGLIFGILIGVVVGLFLGRWRE